MLGRTLLAGGALAVALWPAAASAAPLAEEPTPPALLVSRSDDRSDAGPLEGATLSGTEPLFVFVGPDDAVDDVDEVRFALDGRTVSTERFVNFDLAGTDGFDTVGCNTCPEAPAHPYDPRLLSTGSHDVTATVTADDGTTSELSASFEVQANDPASLRLVDADLGGTTPVDAAPVGRGDTILLGAADGTSEPLAGVDAVRFVVDFEERHVDEAAPYTWDGAGLLAAGGHRLRVEAVTDKGVVVAVYEADITVSGVVLRGALDGLNGSGASGRFAVSVLGDELTVEIEASGLTPGLPHAQHLHGGLAGGTFRCPPPGADADGDGLISTTEGLPFYGSVLVSLTTEGDTSADSVLAIDRFPVADAGGNISYQRSFPPTQELINALPGLHIVQHGVDLDGSGGYDGEAASSLDPSLPLEATIPASCGQLAFG